MVPKVYYKDGISFVCGKIFGYLIQSELVGWKYKCLNFSTNNFNHGMDTFLSLLCKYINLSPAVRGKIIKI